MRASMSSVSPDLLAWRRQTGVDRFDEMWEGELHMNAAPHGSHQILRDDLLVWLKRWWEKEHGFVISQRNLARKEEWPTNYRIPDIVMMTTEQSAYDMGEFIAGPPLVAIEIRRPDDESYDKLPFYADFGVTEVWIIDRRAKLVDLFALNNGEYTRIDSDASGWITSQATPIQLRPLDDTRVSIRHTSRGDSEAILPDH
ncbi:MAG: Uma2 family endonuclease [Pirellulaceae bacterium]